MSLEIPTTNHLLLSLSADQLALLGPLERVELELRRPLERADLPVEFAYFLESGIASIVLRPPNHREMEVGIVGREGTSGLSIIYGDHRSPFDTFMQIAGHAQRAEAGRVRDAMTVDHELHAALLRFARAFSIQVATTAFANGRAKLEERLARWLLMVGDRVGRRLDITHEFLAMMLAVRRSGVTLAVQILEGRGLIRARRGTISIEDREGLIEAANGSYGLAEREYERLLGTHSLLAANTERAGV